MFEMRVHGLGGQGAVTLATWAGMVAYRQGKHVQAFPFFGAERRGAPVKAYLRADESPIDLHSQIYSPDLLVVMSADQMAPALEEGIAPDGKVLVNAGPELAERLSKEYSREVYRIDATMIALEHELEIDGMPMVNIPLLGSIVSQGGLAAFDAVMEILKEVAKRGNFDAYEMAARQGFEEVERVDGRETVG